jgi:cbb3-type cytochrome oxidase maturation protein
MISFDCDCTQQVPDVRLISLLPKMEVIFLLIAISIVAAVGFLAAFLWAVRSGQYDDDQTPAMRILFDEKQSTETNK